MFIRVILDIFVVFNSYFVVNAEVKSTSIHIRDIMPPDAETWEFEKTPIGSGPAILRPNGVSVFGGNKDAICKWSINGKTYYGINLYYYFVANKSYSIAVAEFINGKHGRSWSRDVKVIPETDCESGGRKFPDAGNSVCLKIKEETHSVIPIKKASLTILTSMLKLKNMQVNEIRMYGTEQVQTATRLLQLGGGDDKKSIKIKDRNIIFEPKKHFKKDQKWYMSRYFFTADVMVSKKKDKSGSTFEYVYPISDLVSFAIGSANFKINTPDVDISLVAKRPIYNQTKQPINGEVFFDQLPGGEYTVTVYKSNRPIVTKTFIMDQIDQAVEMDLSK